MRKTGMVRRIDELGRIVIPKEMRKTLRMKEGESFEILLDQEDTILLKKYSSLRGLSDFAQKFVDSISEDETVMITDTNEILACSGKKKKQYLKKRISESFLEKIRNRESIKETMEIIEGEETFCYGSPILVHGDVVGSILFLNEEKSIYERLLLFGTSFFQKYLEDE